MHLDFSYKHFSILTLDLLSLPPSKNDGGVPNSKGETLKQHWPTLFKTKVVLSLYVVPATIFC